MILCYETDEKWTEVALVSGSSDTYLHSFVCYWVFWGFSSFFFLESRGFSGRGGVQR